MIEGDRRFFRRHRDRSHRVRHLSDAERAAFERAGKVLRAPIPGWRWFVAVKQVAPGVRIRQPFQGPEAAEVDLPEDLAAGLWSAVADNERTGAGYGIVNLGGAHE
ncbi:hypothetical protein [Methylobacterium sp. ID0610]|uniref:hypothetical protein n=1 Tax=Methylobacterium carpenticola TaxID=3344827 RepID=UPI0036A15371